MKEKLKIGVGIFLGIVLIVLICLVVKNATQKNSEEIVHPMATFELKDYGTVKMELYPEYAPNTVSNFIALIEAGYYNNKVISEKDDNGLYLAREEAKDETDDSSDDVADANVDDTEESSEDSDGVTDSDEPTVSLIDSSIDKDSDDDYEYEIDGEFVANDFKQNTLRFEKGIVSLNRNDYSSYGLVKEGYNSGRAKFSIIMGEEDVGNLNGLYCAFGRVIEGLDIVEKIYNEAPVKEDSTEATESESSTKEFLNKPVITNASVEKNGVDYGKPDVHEAYDIQSYLTELYSGYTN